MTVSQPDTSPASTTGPGARLAQARDDLRLTREEVAAKLHLSPRQIQALEQDDYAGLPGPTYVRGYLKSYALVVGLSPEPLLEAYGRHIAKPVTPDFSAIAPQKEITSQHHQVRFVTYVVVVIVIGLAFAWWQGRETQAPHPLLTVPAEAPPVEGQAVAPAGPETTIANGQTAPGVVVTDGAGKPLTAAPAPVTPVESPRTAAPAAVTAAAPAVSGGAAPSPAAVAVPPATVPAPAALPTGPRARIVVYTDQESWADIRDARQVKLIYETIAAGRTVALEGVAPVTVFLGNAAGVRLDYNGKTVDVGRYRRGLVARFMLGDEPPAAPTP